MTKFRLVKSAKKENLLLLVAISTLFLVAAASLPPRNEYPRHRVSEKTASPTPTIEEDLIDNVNDGVYTNYEYGFQFKYPKDVFISQRNHSVGSRWLTVGLRGESVSTFLLQDEQMILDVNIGRVDDSGLDIDYFQQNHQTAINGELVSYKVNATKLKNFDIGNVKGYVAKLSTDYEPNVDASYINGYLASWLKDNVIFTLSLDVSGKDKIDKRKELFDAILQSVKFL